jgi:hypothetical protein
MIVLIFYFILLIDCGILLNGFVVIEMLAELGAERPWKELVKSSFVFAF